MSPAEFTAALNRALSALPHEWEAARRGGGRMTTATEPERAHEDASLYNRDRDTLPLHPLDIVTAMARKASAALREHGPPTPPSLDAIFRRLGLLSDRAPSEPFSSGAETSGAGVAEPPRVLEALGKRASFPLRLQSARSYIAPRCALIGCVLRSRNARPAPCNTPLLPPHAAMRHTLFTRWRGRG